MNEKPSRWEYITTIIVLLLCTYWAWYDYQSEPTKIPFEPLVAVVSYLILLFGYLRWKKSKQENIPASSQTAEKIYNFGEVKDGNFGNKVEDAENVVVSTQIDAGRDVHIGNKTIIYNDGRKIDRYLTNPPFNATYFIGREKDLNAIENDYQHHNHLLVLVNGEGGIGKTTLAAKYWYAQETRYQHLAWLYAERGIGAALVSLAASLGVQFEPNDNEATQIARIAEGINNLKMPCLLVLDNANDATDLEKHYVTLHRLAKCHILLTSRVRKMADMKVYEVKPLAPDDVVRLFRHHYPKLIETELPLLNDILRAVGYNTLVTEVLAKNLAVFNRFATQYTLAALLQDLQSKGLLALKNKAVKVVYGSDSLRTAEPTDIIGAMYDLAQLNEAERYLLSNLAVLPADNIPFYSLRILLDMDDDSLETPLNSLEEKGWIEFREADSSFKISPVIQEITRAKQEARLLEDCQALINTLNKKLDRDIIHEDNYQEAGVAAYYGDYVLDALKTPSYNLAVLCDSMGYFYQKVGNLEKALAIYEKARGIVEQLIAAGDDDSDLTDSLAKTLSWLGVVHTSLGNLEQALSFYEEYHLLAAALYEAYPNNVSFKNGLAVAYEKMGETHTSLGNLEQALGFYEEDLKLTKALYEAYPNNVDFKNNLAISYEKLGNTHTALGNLDKALGFYEEMNKLFEALYEAYPNNVDFKNGLAISYSKLGETHTALGNLYKALGFYEEYHRLEKELYTAYPNNVSFKNGLAISYSKLGETHTALGNLDKALGFYEEMNKLLEALYEANPNNVDFKNGLAISYSKLGSTHTSLGNLEQALGFYEEDLKLTKALYEANPNDVEFKNGLAISYQWLGWFFERQKDDKLKSKAYYEDSEKLLIELAISFPSYVKFQNNLKWVQNRLKDLE